MTDPATKVSQGTPKDTIRADTAVRHKNKYENSGLVHQLVLGRFLDALAAELRGFESQRALDFGCGEALFWGQMQSRNVQMKDLTGIDLRTEALSEAAQDFPEHSFLCQDLLTWEGVDRFDLVVASQVLEHLPEPEVFLAKLVELTRPGGRLLLTVPWEPFFMLSNLARGRDIGRLGNHPEHINLWGRNGFARMVEKHATVVKVRSIFPFTLVVAERASAVVDGR